MNKIEYPTTCKNCNSLLAVRPNENHVWVYWKCKNYNCEKYGNLVYSEWFQVYTQYLRDKRLNVKEINETMEDKIEHINTSIKQLENNVDELVKRWETTHRKLNELITLVNNLQNRITVLEDAHPKLKEKTQRFPYKLAKW